MKYLNVQRSGMPLEAMTDQEFADWCGLVDGCAAPGGAAGETPEDVLALGDAAAAETTRRRQARAA